VLLKGDGNVGCVKAEIEVESAIPQVPRCRSNNVVRGFAPEVDVSS
jgi:hypothetical protein